MKKIIVYSIAMMLLVLSCKNVATDSQTIVKTESTPSYEGALSDALSGFEVLPLETTDSCLIGGVDVIKKRMGRYYVQSGRKALHVFGEDGRFIQKIGNIGEGPGEYSILSDFEVDDQYVYLLSLYKVYVYSLDGVFQKEIPLESNIRTIRKAGDGFLALVNSEMEDDRLAYMDKEWQVKKTAMKGNNLLRLVRSIPWLALDDDTYIYQMSYSNDLYAFDVEKGEFFQLEATDNPNAVSFEKLLSMENPDMDLQEMSGMIFDGYCCSGEQLMFVGMEDGDMSLHLYDRESDKACIFEIPNMDDDVTYTQWGFFRRLGNCDSDDDYLFTYMEANVLNEALDKAGVLDKEAYVKMKDIDEENNPVIFRFKFNPNV